MNIYEKLNIPIQCEIDKTIFKKTFYENAPLTKTDKALFTDSISKITWLYCLNQDTLNVIPYKTTEREYIEIEVIEVELAEEKGIKRIAEIVMRAIPYPMMLFFKLGDKFQLYLSHQRFNFADNSKITLDKFESTEWFDCNISLWDKLDFKGFRYTNFFDMYSDIIDAVSLYNAISITQDDITPEQARELLRRNAEIENQLALLRAKLKKATEFNRKMEINMEIKWLEKERLRYGMG